MSAPESHIRQKLEQLALRPPQTLLVEGGTEEQRLGAAFYWASTHNCPAAHKLKKAGQPATPCLECLRCRQIQANENLDLLIYDGRIPNKLDEEKPGPIKAMRMENMRDLKSMTGTAPHGEGKRVVIFQGMSLTREEALNSLLKTLEEPSPHTLFVLLAPQREQLLPTLVSRSFCITLPWTSCRTANQDIDSWVNELAEFLARGTGFLERVAGKGAMDANIAGQIVLACQKALARCLGQTPSAKLDSVIAPLAANPGKAAMASAWLDEAQAMLIGTVNPPRVLEALSAKLFTLLRQQG